MLGGYRRICYFLALLLTFCAAAYTQQVFGSIFGTVTDPSGSSVTGAKVTVTDINKGTQFEVSTDVSGNYNKGQLVPGQYTVARPYFWSSDRELFLSCKQPVRTPKHVRPGEVVVPIIRAKLKTKLSTSTILMI